MHRPLHPSSPTLAAVAAALLLIAVPTPSKSADAPEVLDRARALLDKGEAGPAVTLLEGSLAGTPPDQHAAILELLRSAYGAAAKEADSKGKSRDAEIYRDNLEILNRKHPTPQAQTPIANLGEQKAPATSPTGSEGVVSKPAPPTPPISAPSEAPLSEVPPAKSEPLLPEPAPIPVGSATAPSPSLAPAPAPASTPARVEITTADAAFREKRYDEAGKLYTALDRQGRLPAARKDHWAYCRCVEVVRRINAKPATPQEWAEIDAEIQRIRELSPNNWYGNYLSSLASERSSGARAKASNRVVVRGAAPEETPLGTASPQAKPAPSRGRADKPKREAPQPSPSPAPRPEPEAPRASQPSMPGTNQWQVHETTNFRILHNDPALAEKAAEVAEVARETQLKRWVGAPPRAAWTPKCELYLYPTARVFSQMTGQPEQSPGFSTMGMSGGKIIARRVNLRADHPNLLKAVMPHEITHVVLADLFPQQQIPRWADEGMAVLAEPTSEQHMRAADLVEPLASGQLFKLEDLMAMDYPEGKFWGLYYAQSVSLTRFLVEQATPDQFVQFVQKAQTSGVEPELRRIYKIDGYADLQKRWLAYARSKSSEATASSADVEKGSTTPRR